MLFHNQIYFELFPHALTHEFTHASLVTASVLCLLPYWAAALGVTVPPIRVFAVAQLLGVPLVCAFTDFNTLGSAAARSRRTQSALLLCCAVTAVALLALGQATSGPVVVGASAALGACSAVTPLGYALCASIITESWQTSRLEGRKPLSPGWAAATLALATGSAALAAPQLASQAAAAGGLAVAAAALACVAMLTAGVALLVSNTDEVFEDEPEIPTEQRRRGSRSLGTALVVIRLLMTFAAEVIVLAMAPRHGALFAMPVIHTERIAAAMTVTQLSVWAILAPGFLTLLRGPLGLQMASAAGACLAVAAWLGAVSSPSQLALPLAAFAVAAALARTASDVALLLTASASSFPSFGGALMGTAWAAQEAMRHLVAPALVVALGTAASSPAYSTCISIAAASAGLAAALALAVRNVGGELGLPQAPQALSLMINAPETEDAGDLQTVEPVPMEEEEEDALLGRSAANAGGRGAFTGTVVIRRRGA